MDKYLLDALHCPFCLKRLIVTKGDAHLHHWEYAVLSCYCERYPVVAGIPIIRKGVVGSRGETARAVSYLIEAGRNEDALLAMAVPKDPATANLAPKWLQRLPHLRGMGRIRSVAGRFAIPRWRKHAEDFLTAGPQGRTAKDYFDFHFLHSELKQTEYSYFVNRFGQPRHLVALSLMTLIDSPRKPVLDFGCGFGHLTRHLPLRVGHQPIIGADREFIRLYVAKNFLAPDALYICTDGDAPLPFSNEFFSVAYTSDTLFMVTSKALCTKELKRVVDSDGLLIVAGIRNGLVDPDKYPINMALPHYCYTRFFDDVPHRILSSGDVLDQYVKKCGPAISRSSAKHVLDNDPWVSIVATKREELLVDRGPLADWPHAEGRLELNPLYKPDEDLRNGTGQTLYRHTFPSSWYEQEDGDCRKYEPDKVSISSQVLNDLSVGKRTADMEDLIARCVIVGIPDRFH